MTTYPGNENERRVPAESLKEFLALIFARCGMSGEDADLLADTLVSADLRGVHSHGTMRVPAYVKKLRDEGVDPAGRPRMVRDSGAAMVVDGGNSMGQIGSTFAMRHAIERARTAGVAFAAVRGSNHCGAMSYYTMLALPYDMIGIAATNALPTMASWGGIDKIVGINPLSVAIPTGEECPIVYDAAFSYSAHGKIHIYRQKGLPIPDTWAFDKDGRTTTDAAKAMEGLLQPIGGYKGTSLALIMGVLSAVLSGASYGTELGNMVDGPRAGQDGHFFMAINVVAFEDVALFKSRTDKIVREIHASKLAAGYKRVYSPGEIEAETEARYREEGIPLNDETLRELSATAASLGVDASTLA